MILRRVLKLACSPHYSCLSFSPSKPLQHLSHPYLQTATHTSIINHLQTMSTGMSTSPLLNLPLEIKDRIFTEVFPPHSRIYYSWNHPAASRPCYVWVPKNLLHIMSSTLHRDVWYTLATKVSLNIYIGDIFLKHVLESEDEGWVVDTARRQGLINNFARAHRINLIVRRNEHLHIDREEQLVAVLTLIQGVAGWQNKAITIEFGKRLQTLSKSAGVESRAVSAAVIAFLAGCERGRIVPEVRNVAKAARHWKDVLEVYSSRFIPEAEMVDAERATLER